MRTEEENISMLSQTKERQEPPKADRGKEGLSPRAVGGIAALLVFLFWTLTSRTLRDKNFCCLKALRLWEFVAAALGNLGAPTRWSGPWKMEEGRNSSSDS